MGRRGQCEVRGHPVNVRPVGDLDGFGVEFQAEGRDVLVRVAGEVDAATAPLLSAELDRARDHSDGDVRVDLAAVTFFDCAALRALVHARSGLTKQGRRLVVTDPAPTARRVFELTGLLGILQPEASPGRY